MRLLGVGGGCIVHSGLVIFLVPWITTLLSFMINMIDLSMKAMYLWSQRRPTDSSAPDWKTEKMCALLASGGRDGSSRLHVCDS